MTEFHIIEPTLADQSGHCHGYVYSLLQADCRLNYEMHIWLDRRGQKLLSDTNCKIHPYFFRRFRKWQMFFCLWYLSHTLKFIFIPTAKVLDLIYISQLLKRRNLNCKIFLHFHQLNYNAKNINRLKKIAKLHPELIILTPTPGLTKIFKECGFIHCECVPCPSYKPLTPISNESVEFQKVIYAGAARKDKGFPIVVNFIKYLVEKDPSIAIELQVSPPHSGRYDKESKAALKYLKFLRHPKLTLHKRTLDQENYQKLYHNAICLLLYDFDSYRNKFSGVALDAFYAGCPVICINNTWMSDVTRHFNAGIVLDDRSPEMIFSALQTIKNNYSYYYHNAKRAGETLMREHDPSHTLTVIDNYIQGKGS